MNENIKKLYDKKVIELNKAKGFMLSIFDSEEQLEMALKIFRTRHDIIYTADNRRLIRQAAYISTKCLKLVFGDVINEETVLRLEGYDCLIDHVETIQEYLNDDTAVLVREPYSIGEDDYDLIVIASLDKYLDGYHKNYWALFDKYQGNFYGDEIKISIEKENKVIEYWKEKGYVL